MSDMEEEEKIIFVTPSTFETGTAIVGGKLCVAVQFHLSERDRIVLRDLSQRTGLSLALSPSDTIRLAGTLLKKASEAQG